MTEAVQTRLVEAEDAVRTASDGTAGVLELEAARVALRALVRALDEADLRADAVLDASERESVLHELDAARRRRLELVASLRMASLRVVSAPRSLRRREAQSQPGVSAAQRELDAITDSLRRTQEAVRSEIHRSEATSAVLKDSTRTLVRTRNEHATMSGDIKRGQRAMRALKNRDRLDSLILFGSVLLFVCTVMFVGSRRTAQTKTARGISAITHCSIVPVMRSAVGLVRKWIGREKMTDPQKFADSRLEQCSNAVNPRCQNESSGGGEGTDQTKRSKDARVTPSLVPQKTSHLNPSTDDEQSDYEGESLEHLKPDKSATIRPQFHLEETLTAVVSSDLGEDGVDPPVLASNKDDQEKPGQGFSEPDGLVDQRAEDDRGGSQMDSAPGGVVYDQSTDSGGVEEAVAMESNNDIDTDENQQGSRSEQPADTIRSLEAAPFSTSQSSTAEDLEKSSRESLQGVVSTSNGGPDSGDFEHDQKAARLVGKERPVEPEPSPTLPATVLTPNVGPSSEVIEALHDPQGSQRWVDRQRSDSEIETPLDHPSSKSDYVNRKDPPEIACTPETCSQMEGNHFTWSQILDSCLPASSALGISPSTPPRW
mmetsp:Transcript_13218/g.26836  ORF Transcript_13218/g.26836 Transcript_13218/m.26836 type:complete len:600 (-) Transcript_13218:2362-4161(-)